MDSVLVGVDHSDAARRAVEFALQRARINQWEVTLVNVINWSPYSFNPPADNEARPLARQQELRVAEAEVMDPILAWIESQGFGDVQVRSTIRHGRPSEVLADLAAEQGHDLIVVARTGESNLRNAIFGSTASRLVQHATVPVLVVPS